MRTSKKLVSIAGSVLAGGALVGSLAATSASAAPFSGGPSAPSNMKSAAHHYHPRACPVDLNGGNTLDLKFQGQDYQYPVFLHVRNRDGDISGVLFDKYLNGGTLLPVTGNCTKNGVLLGILYPAGSVQGFRFVGGTFTSVSPTQDTVGGNWSETGSEQGNGTASLVNPVDLS